ncbi:hypothetical protein [Kitasatospora sp. NPDC059571]|uniref:hypothetical protein n=1 Tax=Kitasatospora sp. NPDC059571 TaxID=3346871 RepID=UPI0036BB6E6E
MGLQSSMSCQKASSLTVPSMAWGWGSDRTAPASALDRRALVQRSINVRHAEAFDMLLAGITGSPARPQAVLVQNQDGRQEISPPRLTAVQAQQVPAAAAGTAGSACR